MEPDQFYTRDSPVSIDNSLEDDVNVVDSHLERFSLDDSLRNRLSRNFHASRSKMELFFKKHPDFTLIISLWFLGLCFRLYLALTTHGLVFVDEIFQSKEMAHKWLYGSGIVPWEFQVPSNPREDGAARSPFHALSYMMLFLIGDFLGWQWRFTIKMTAIMDAVVSSLVIPAIYLVTKEFLDQSRVVSLIAAFLTATWFWLFWLGTHSFSNVYYTPLLLLGFWLLLKDNNARNLKYWRVPLKKKSRIPIVVVNAFLSGMLLGMAFMLRIDTLAYLLTFLLLYRPNDYRHSDKQVLAFLIGFAITGVLVLGILDWWAFGRFWVSPWNNFKYNFIEGKVYLHGNAPLDWYVVLLFGKDGPFFLPFIISASMLSFQFIVLSKLSLSSLDDLIEEGIIPRPQFWVKTPEIFNQLKLVLMLVMIFVAFSLSPSKHLRFLYPWLPIFFSFMAAQLVVFYDMLQVLVRKGLDLLSMLKVNNAFFRKLLKYREKIPLLVLLTMVFTGLAYLAVENEMQANQVDLNYFGDVMMAMTWIGEQKDSRGIFAFVGSLDSGGYFHLHKNIPVIFQSDVNLGLQQLLTVDHDLYNYVLVPRVAYRINDTIGVILSSLNYSLVHVQDQKTDVWKFQ